MEIKIAKSAGFCYGVANAVKQVEELVDNNSDGTVIQTLGPIIHNEYKVAQLEKRGVKIINAPDEAPADSVVVIRAHGVTKEVYDTLVARNVRVIDGTCKYVKKIHDLVRKKSQEGYGIVVVGDKNHQEVIGVCGWAEGKAYVVGDVEDLNDEQLKLLHDTTKGLCFVAQTTITIEKWEKIIEISKKMFQNVIKFDTICNATKMRQADAAHLAEQVDAMFIIGSKSSSNTLKLFEVCKERCEDTFLVESLSDVSPLIIKKYLKVGISAGASAPEEMIKEVISKMSEINEKGLSFEEMLEDYIDPAKQGSIVKGTVIRTTDEGVFVDIGAKSEGLIPMDEFTNDPNFVPNETIKVGDEIEAKIFRMSDKEGTITLSKRDIDRAKNLKTFQTALESKEVFETTVARAVKGGVICNVNGTDVFVPAALLSDRFVRDTAAYVGQPIKINIISVDEKRNSVRGSAKELIIAEKEAQEAAVWDKITVGDTMQGTVKNFTDFRAFVDLGGVDGSIHISELSWNRIKHPSEVLTIGDTVEVKVLSADRETKKISLGFRKAEDNPWFKAEEKYAVGTVVTGNVVRIVAFGAFIELEKGIDALCHISQISDYRIAKVDEALTVGQEVQAKVIEFDADKKRISLSIREVEPINPPERVAEAEARAAERAEREAARAAEKAEREAARAAKAAEKAAMSGSHVEEMNNTIGDLAGLQDLLNEME